MKLISFLIPLSTNSDRVLLLDLKQQYLHKDHNEMQKEGSFSKRFLCSILFSQILQYNESGA